MTSQNMWVLYPVDNALPMLVACLSIVLNAYSISVIRRDYILDSCMI